MGVSVVQLAMDCVDFVHLVNASPSAANSINDMRHALVCALSPVPRTSSSILYELAHF